MMRFFAMAVSATVFMACPAWAKHPQCAGNPEPEKCEKMRDELDRETPAQKKERTKRLSENKAITDKVVSTQPNYKHIPSHQAPRIGMSAADAIDSTWGRPENVNRTTTAAGVDEQWIYGIHRYLYFTNGVLRVIQD